MHRVRIIDANTVEVAGEVFKARALVLALGAEAIRLDVPGQHLNGVHDFATLVETLDREPATPWWSSAAARQLSNMAVSSMPRAVAWSCWFAEGFSISFLTVTRAAMSSTACVSKVWRS